MGGGGGCSRCEDIGVLEDMRSRVGETGVWGLGEVRHVFRVTFLFIINDVGLEGGRGACVVREALYVEETEALVASLLVLCAAVKLSVTKCTLEIHSHNIGTILVGEGGRGLQR